jgi:hypothetical protein
MNNFSVGGKKDEDKVGDEPKPDEDTNVDEAQPSEDKPSEAVTESSASAEKGSRDLVAFSLVLRDV